MCNEDSILITGVAGLNSPVCTAGLGGGSVCRRRVKKVIEYRKGGAVVLGMVGWVYRE